MMDLNSQKRLVKQYNSISCYDQNRLEIAETLRFSLSNPEDLKEEFLEGSQEQQECQLIYKTFNQITNGLFHQPFNSQITSISERSLFFYWSLFIQSLYNFYMGQSSQSLELLNKIPEECCLSEFKPFLRGLIYRHEELLPSYWTKLLNGIRKEKKQLSNLLFDLNTLSIKKESSLFIETFFQCLNYSKNESKEFQLSLAKWGVDKILEHQFFSTRVVKEIIDHFHNFEGNRLLALGTLPYESDRSLFFWFNALSFYILEENAQEAKVKALITIIKQVTQEVSLEFDLTQEYLEGLKDHLDTLINRLTHTFPIFVQFVEEKGHPVYRIRQLGDSAPPFDHRRLKQKGESENQLHLF